MKRILILLILTVLAASILPQRNASAATFTDVPSHHWAKPSIDEAVRLGIVQGYPDGRFGPDDIVRADEFLAMIYRAHIKEYTDENGKIRRDFDRDWFKRADEYQPAFTFSLAQAVLNTGFDFQSAKTGYWAKPYIDLAYESGYLSKYSTAFPPTYDFRKPITREQASFLLGAWYNRYEFDYLPSYEEYALEKSGLKDLSDFSLTEVGHYRATVLLAGLMRGSSDQRFDPKRYVTRAEAVTMVLRLKNPSLRSPFKPDLAGVCYTQSALGDIEIIRDQAKCKMITDIFALAEKTSTTSFFGYWNYGVSLYESRQVFDEWVRDMKLGYFDPPHKAAIGFDTSSTEPWINLRYSKTAVESSAKEPC